MDISRASNRVLRMRDLPNKVGFRPSTIYEMVAAGRFPRPFKLVSGGRATGWLESEIDSWLDERARSGGTPCSTRCMTHNGPRALTVQRSGDE